MRLNTAKFDLDKLVLLYITDVHLGSQYCDKELLNENVEWALQTPNVYVIDGGDLLETATKDSVGAGVFEQDMIVEKQIEEATKIYKPLAESGKLLGLHRGNHEYRVFQHSGTNLTKIVSQILGVKYFGDGVLHYFQVGRENYTLYSCHGSSGARLPHTKIKSAIDLANMVDVEVYLMGHLHQLSHHTRVFYNVDKRKKMVVEGQKHFVLGGSYLDHWGSYGQMKGYEMMRKGSPKIKLHGDEHVIRVSL